MVYKFSIPGILNALLPVSCALCQEPTGSHRPVCSSCLADFPSIGDCCYSCSLPLNAAGTCGQCQEKPPAYDAAHALFHYLPPVNTLIQQLKFNDRIEYARLFGELLAAKLSSVHEQPDMLIPVPLHRSRLRKRGYNQAWEMTRTVSRLTGIPASRTVCQRTRKTPLQTGLGAAQRRKNLEQAFTVQVDVTNMHVGIVDDVMTTGSTLNEMARCLKHAGARKVSGIVAARVVL